MQLFWHAQGSHANEANSVRFMATPGSNSVDLALFAGLRLDLDTLGVYSTLGINTVELGC